SRWSSCFESRRSTSSESSRRRNSLGATFSSAAWRTRRSSDWSTPERRSFFRIATSSSVGCMTGLLVGDGEQRAEIAGEARRLERQGGDDGSWQRLLVERLLQDCLDRRVAVARVEARPLA